MGTNTGIGIGIGIPFKNNALGGDRPYLPPELKARLIGVWDNYGKKNTDADRNIIKNKIPNAGGDLEILNAAYEGMSGYNGYSVIFGINKTWKNVPTYNSIYSINDNKIHITKVLGANRGLIFSYVKLNDQLYDITEIPSFKIRVSGLKGDSKLRYSYIKTENAVYQTLLDLDNGIHKLPKSFRPTNSIVNNSWIGFTISPRIENEISFDCDITIEILPEYEGAFVTDGVDDMIISQKTLQEMGVTKDFTIVSMIHQITLRGATAAALTNYIRQPIGYEYVRNHVANIGKTGIYGYVVYDVNHSSAGNSHIINTILGDKNDYSINITGNLSQGKFSVQGYINGEDNIVEISRVAHYWTFALLGKATEDEINLIIGNYNLDRSLKPDILCNIGKQGITNDNHAEFNDKLIDYSGNGRDIQMNNLAWKGDSGIGKYETELSNTSIWTQSKETTCSPFSSSYNGLSGWIVFANTELTNSADMPSFKIQVKGLLEGQELIYRYYDSNGQSNVYSMSKDGEYTLPSDVRTAKPQISNTSGFQVVKNETNIITITQIPSHVGALYLDGVSDFGKVTGMPIYKDYTFIIDREIISIGNTAGVVASKSEDSTDVNKQGAFLFEYLGAPNNISAWSFYKDNGKVANTDFTRGISYQSTYSYNGKDLTIGTSKDSDKLWLGTIRDNDSRFFNGAIYSLMSFPYSMSEFLIERQLKKHKLGTLYPDMVEFRPVIKANANYKITCYQIDSTNTWKLIKVGDYIVIGAKLAFQITFDNDASELKEVVSPQLSDIIVEKRPSNPGYNIYSYITSKSPQKINITIDEYIRYEDIVQPYPVLLRFKDENGNEVSWGGKVKLGSSITRIGSFNDCNLLKGIYTVSNAKLNGSPLSSTPHVVERQMVFTCTATYLLDDNEPKCILSPSRLRIPNSSYKLLGYIPDISGHGNHGVIYNSAYAEGSGVNEDGSYQFDGVDDFVTIPTVTGGKQVLMKVNWQSDVGAVTLYDQRLNISDYEFAIYNSTRDLDDNPVMAYQGRNNGQTYIDGILNSNIMASELKAITHNITITNELSLGINNTYPVIGSTRSNTHFAQMSLYDFMLFDEISTDDKIKELNKYVGVEAKVELPPYYWDTYGKTNSDADRDVIQQRGIAVGDYDLTNYNHAYDKMSGYGGYKFAKFDNELDWYLTPDNGYIDVVSRNGYSITLRNLSTLNYGWYFQNSTVKEFITKDIPFKVKANKSIRVYWNMHSYNSDGKNFAHMVNNITLNPNEDTSINLRHLTEEELTKLGANKDRMYYLLCFDLSTLAVDEEVTIEMLPLYPNGLVYDGITDYSKNANIPVLTDYTYIYKRTIINIPTNAATLLKGADKTNGGAFIADYGNKWQFNFGQYNIIQGIADRINWQTVNSFNGTSINKGENTDDSGITVAKFSNGYTSIVFYKLILYPKTISLLEINFLKNLMEKDEIIDLNNPIFIKNE